MAEWVALNDEETADYLSGHLVPLQARETDHGVEVWMPHTWQEGRFTGVKTCARCHLLPMDYDSVGVPCVD